MKRIDPELVLCRVAIFLCDVVLAIGAAVDALVAIFPLLFFVGFPIAIGVSSCLQRGALR